jgi:anti-sigma B factor antagonist
MKNKKKQKLNKELLAPEGQLTIYRVDELKRELLSLLNSNDFLELDIGNVNECDTAGLQLLCSLKKTSIETKKKFIITGESKSIEDVMVRTGITSDMIERGWQE